ncbi:hypothetical protein [Staphylococcus epidermidis]
MKWLLKFPEVYRLEWLNVGVVFVFEGVTVVPPEPAPLPEPLGIFNV